jgi:hypothetical protein
MRLALIAIAATALCVSAAAADPWATLATRDLDAIHDLLLANHPGPVDPQNPAFKDWLEKGLREAKARAATAASLEDYQRAVRFYTNGFRDGHIGVGFYYTPRDDEWPAFVVGADGNAVTVAYADNNAGVPVGAKLISCDGQSVDALLAARSDPYYWNAGIPHLRFGRAYHLFYQAEADNQPKLESCVFSSGTVTLHWRKIADAELQKTLDHAQGRDTKLPSVKQIDGVWLVSLPRFYFQTDAETAAMHAVIGSLKKNADVMRKGTVVFDVRGNNGGNSNWGEEVVGAFWGEGWRAQADALVGGNVVDWRASPANLAMLRKDKEQAAAAGLETGSVNQDIAAIEAAIKQKKTFAHVVDMSDSVASATPPPNPVTGRVYFLTDNACGSACLDFADLMHKLPGVVQVGLPTSADTVYMDIANAPLPSGLAQLGWGMKVYRDRSRGNNVWYEPKYLWAGGAMNDDEAIMRWIKSLPRD